MNSKTTMLRLVCERNTQFPSRQIKPLSKDYKEYERLVELLNWPMGDFIEQNERDFIAGFADDFIFGF